MQTPREITMSDQAKTLTIEQAIFEPQAQLTGLQARALGVGAVGTAALAAGYFLAPEHFYHAYLTGWLLWFGVAAGLFMLGMLNHVSGGLWGVMMRRVTEAAGRTLPFFLIASIPLLLGLEELFPWATPEAANDPLIQHKASYLNPTAFTVRMVVFFAIWSGLAFLVSSLSRRQDSAPSEAIRLRLKKLSAAGLVLWMLTSTLASVDWVMSLDPHWFSSLFGISFVAGQGLSGLCFIVLFMLFLRRGKPFDQLVKPKLFHDYGKLMLAFIMLWAYFVVSQYLIIWSGNLPEEITWYIDRNANGWKLISVLLVVGHFALPFGLLLSQDLKSHAKRLRWVAIWVLAMRWLDFYWQVTPNFSHQKVAFHWLDLAAPAAIGGIWVWLLVAQFKGRPALPVEDPLLKQAVARG